MQTLVQVVCKPGKSLREAIAKSRGISKFCLEVTLQKRPGRKHGWAKVHGTRKDRRGAMNLEWNANANILTGRVITKGRNRANQLISDFVNFLLGTRLRGRTKSITIFPG